MATTIRTLLLALAIGGCAGAAWAKLEDARGAVPAASAAELDQDLLAREVRIAPVVNAP